MTGTYCTYPDRVLLPLKIMLIFGEITMTDSVTNPQMDTYFKGLRVTNKPPLPPRHLISSWHVVPEINLMIWVIVQMIHSILDQFISR